MSTKDRLHSLDSLLTKEQKTMLKLERAIPRLRGKSRGAAVSLLERWNHGRALTQAQWEYAKVLAAPPKQLSEREYSELGYLSDNQDRL